MEKHLLSFYDFCIPELLEQIFCMKNRFQFTYASFSKHHKNFQRIYHFIYDSKFVQK